MSSPNKSMDSSENENFNENVPMEKSLKEYSTYQLYDTIKVQEVLLGISLAGFYSEDRYQENAAKAPDTPAYFHITQLKLGQILDGVVVRGNRLGWSIDIGVGPVGFLHKTKMKGLNIQEGCLVSVEITNLDLSKNQISLDLHSVLKNDKPAIDPALLNVSSKMTCSVCTTDFENRDEQVQHYKLDWHRYNLKMKIMGENSVTEEQFDKLANEDDLSSLSGTDSKSDEESANDSAGYNTSGSEAKGSPMRKIHSKLMIKNRLPLRERSDSVTSTDTECEDDRLQAINARFQPKLYLCNNKGQVVALYRNVVHGKENIPEQQSELLTMVKAVPYQMKWAIILLGGGHFAAAIFQGAKSIFHKTFHRYTVRAKQGGAQGAKDAQGGRPPKSGGATLRRYNEAALLKEIQDLLQTWNEELQGCHVIFYRAASYNRVILIGGKNSPFKKTDPRLRTIPFPTRRATYSEVQRIHKVLSTLECFGDKKLYENTLPQSPKVYLGNKSPKKMFSKKDGKETSQKSKLVLPTKLEVLPDIDIQNENENLVEDDETDLTLVEEIHNLNELKIFDNTKVKKKKGKRKSSLPRRQESPISTPLDGEVYQYKTALYSACKSGDTTKLLNLLQLADEDAKYPENFPNMNNNENIEKLDNFIPFLTQSIFSLSMLNEPFGEGGSTFLHVAAKEGHKDLVKMLMQHGASPCIKNKKGFTPYVVAEDKETRNEFRKFWDNFPEKFDYTQSQIPGPLTQEQEKEQQLKQAERNKERKKVKKERLKGKKLEIATRKAEEEEQRRYLSLSDREKRALAAERRLVETLSNTTEMVTLSRCFLCAADITGKVPFEYNNCRFCSIKCVKEHRKKN